MLPLVRLCNAWKKMMLFWITTHHLLLFVLLFFFLVLPLCTFLIAVHLMVLIMEVRHTEMSSKGRNDEHWLNGWPNPADCHYDHQGWQSSSLYQKLVYDGKVPQKSLVIGWCCYCIQIVFKVGCAWMVLELYLVVFTWQSKSWSLCYVLIDMFRCLFLKLLSFYLLYQINY